MIKAESAAPYVDPLTGGIARHRLSRRMLRLGIAFWFAASSLYLTVLRPLVVTQLDVGSNVLIPNSLAAVAIMALPSFSLALLLTILTLSPHTKVTLFKPTRARLLGTLVFWTIFPVLAWGAMPFTTGYIVGTFLTKTWRWAFQNGHSPVLDDLTNIFVALAALPICYAVACLLSSGLPKWWLRFLGYCLVWSGIYALLPLSGLMTSGNL